MCAAAITGYQVKLNPALLGYPIKAFINLEVEPVQKKEFYPYIEKVHNVVECNCVTGDYSMLIEGLFVISYHSSSTSLSAELTSIWDGRGRRSCSRPPWSTAR
ncbi:MAG: Lrp/AsnC family transcriptional regulator [Clostridia bacterium]